MKVEIRLENVVVTLEFWFCLWPTLLKEKGQIYLWDSQHYWDTGDRSAKPKILNPSSFQTPLKQPEQMQLPISNIKFEKDPGKHHRPWKMTCQRWLL